MSDFNNIQEDLKYEYRQIQYLNSGENSHQNAGLYTAEKQLEYEILSGDELTYLNIINITTALNCVSEFFDVNCTVIVKNGTPCAMALGKNIDDAYIKAVDSDPINACSCNIAFSGTVDAKTAEHLCAMAVEVVAAPDFEPKASELLEKNKFTKVIKLKTPLKDYRQLLCEDIKTTPFGTLIQTPNKSELDKNMFKVVTTAKPVTEQIEDAVFAWKTVKYARSTGVVIAKDFKTMAIGQGQTNLVTAIEHALDFACDGSKDAVAAFDEPITDVECIYAAAQGRIALIIQPGGTIKDKEIIAAANKYNIVMITTGITNIRI